MGDRSVDASNLSNEELFSAIVRMDVPPAPSTALPSGQLLKQDMHRS